MPQFIHKEGRHIISYVTGPSHVLLGVRFSEKSVAPALIKLSAQGSCSHGGLDEGKIREAVQEVLAAHRDEGKEVFAAEFVYVENDSPRYDLYRIAMHALTKRYLTAGAFEHVE